MDLQVDGTDGAPGSQDALWEKSYSRLHQLARVRLRFERRRATFCSEELVQETYRRLATQAKNWIDCNHLCGTAALAMRRILIDRARMRARLKRNEDLSLPDREYSAGLSGYPSTVERSMMLVRRTLESMKRVDERQARIVELRFLVGLTAEETAEVLQISRRTVDREWVHAKCWLRRELDSSQDSPSEAILR